MQLSKIHTFVVNSCTLYHESLPGRLGALYTMNSNITLQQLIYIVAVDTHGSFVEAAEECKVSQPALSMQIRKLENTLGVTLFDRSRQPIRSTDIGRRIIAQGRLVLREAGRIQETVDVAQGEMKGEYRLGAVRSLASWLLPSVLRAFTAEYPGVIVTVRELPVEELVEELQRDQLDAGLAPLPVPVDTLIDRPLFYEPFLAYIPRTHPLYELERIAQRSCRSEPSPSHTHRWPVRAGPWISSLQQWSGSEGSDSLGRGGARFPAAACRGGGGRCHPAPPGRR